MSQADLLQRALDAIDTLTTRLEQAEARTREPIAVVGLACRFPGGVASPDEYWRLLREGRSGIVEIPPDRWAVDDWYDPNPDSVGTMSTRYGGFLGRVDEFDAALFRISPREASTLDPQQRLLLECAWEALEHAGIAPDSLTNSPTGVFVGITSSDYARLLRIGEEDSDVYSATGTALNAAAGRISFVLGLQGPCMAVDTACSSSLVATHLACQSLRNHECDHALVGGVNVMLSPEPFVLFSKWGMLANSGECRTFDAGASGFVRGEGCGLLVLKRLGDALAAGDHVHAIIRGSAISQDGPSSGLSVPNGPAQVKAIRAALERAGIAPGEVGFVEAHGTGTPLGDPIELEALGEVYRDGHSRDEPLLVGSVKPSIGHLESAAGVAGLIKLVLTLEHGELPPQRNYAAPNPRIDWDDLPIRVVDALQPWPAYRSRRIGAVSSFGFSGTNVHVVVEAGPGLAGSSAAARGVHVLPLSARSGEALRAGAGALAARIERIESESDSDSESVNGYGSESDSERESVNGYGSESDSDSESVNGYGSDSESESESESVALTGAERTLMVGRARLPHRVAVVGSSAAELAFQLREFAGGEVPAGVVTGVVESRGEPQVAFLYSGQGSQYHRMGLQLREAFPVFREAFDRCATLLADSGGPDLLDILSGADDGLVHQTAITQPALFAVEYALTQLFASWGIRPGAVFGHSIGEYVAACVAGVLSLQDAVRLIAARGRLMQALPAGGGMLAVAAEAALALEIAHPYADRVSLAARNGPDDVVLSGALDALREIAHTLDQRGIRHKPLNVSHAFHSPLMEPMRAEFEATLRSVGFHAPTLPLASNLTGTFDPAAGSTPEYWSRHVREPVAFEHAMRTMAGRCTVFLELGPRPVLLGMARRFLDADRHTWVGTLRGRPREAADVLEGLGALWTAGVPCDWEGYLDGAGRRIALPTYPFQRKRYWAARMPTRRRGSEGDALGRGRGRGRGFDGDMRVGFGGIAVAPGQRIESESDSERESVNGYGSESDSESESVLVGESDSEREGVNGFVGESDSESESVSYGARATGADARRAHPLLGGRIASPLRAAQFACTLDPGDPVLADHRVADLVVFPAAGYIELARAAGEALLGGPVKLEAGRFHAALVLDESKPCDVHLVCTPDGDALQFELFSRPRTAAPDEPWTGHAGGRITRLDAAGPHAGSATTDGWTIDGPTATDPMATGPTTAEPASADFPSGETVDIAAYRARMADAGLDYGPAFQALVSAHRFDGVSHGDLLLDDSAAHQYGVHPGLLDAAFHLIGLALEAGANWGAGAGANWGAGADAGAGGAGTNLYEQPKLPDATHEISAAAAPSGANLHEQPKFADAAHEDSAAAAPSGANLHEQPKFADAAHKMSAAAAPSGANLYEQPKLPDATHEISAAAAPFGANLYEQPKLPDATQEISPAVAPSGANLQEQPKLPDATHEISAAAAPSSANLHEQPKFADATQKFFLPVSFAAATFRRNIGQRARAQCLIRHADETSVGADIAILDENGELLARIDGLEARAVSPKQFRRVLGVEPALPLLGLEWRRVSLPSTVPHAATGGAAPGAAATKQWQVLAADADAAEPVLAQLRALGVTAEFATHLSAQSTNILDLRALTISDPCTATLALFRELASGPAQPGRRVVLVTRAAQQVAEEDRVDPAATALWGIAATAAAELPNCEVRLLDLDAATATLDGDSARAIAAVCTDQSAEDRHALRNGEGHVARLVPLHAAASPPGATSATADTRIGAPGATNLVVRNRGDLSGLALEPARRNTPGPRQVEVEVLASGLNFRDVLNLLDMYPGEAGALGNECCGRVVAVGSDVSELRPGDLVCCIAEGTFGSHVIAEADLTFAVPRELSIAQAATFPIAYLTAYLALHRIGRIRVGQRVLIHAAAGGVGLAAVTLARAAGAEVLATAGSEEKREYLRNLGIRHVFDSRTPLSALTVLEATDGHGVDLLLNSLTGEAIDQGLHSLAPGGHFLEIGLREVRKLAQVEAIRDDIAYTPLLLGDWCRRAPAAVRAMWGDLIELLSDGRIEPPPVRTFPIAAAESAFRFMARARHIGRLAVTHPATVTPIRDDGAYVVTGGLGALGLHVAEWLAERGAKHLILLGRSAPGDAAHQRIARLKHHGTRVDVIAADVTRATDLEFLRAYDIPVRGIVHAAGIVDDALLPNQDDARLQRVLAPKLEGALNLLRTVPPAQLDFVVFFSSGSAVLGSPGQAAYAGANAALDGLAHRLRTEGHNAISINWGAWQGSGMAAAVDERTAHKWRERGIGRLNVDTAVAILDDALNRGSAQLAALPMQWPRFLRALAHVPPLLSALAPPTRTRTSAQPHIAQRNSAQQQDGAQQHVAQQRDDAPAEKQQLTPARIAEHVLATVARVVGLRRDEIDVQTDLGSLGLDSLMAIEAKNRFESQLGVGVSSVRLLQGGRVRELIDELVRDLGIVERAAAAQHSATDVPTEGAPAAQHVATDAPVERASAAHHVATEENVQEFPLSHPQRALWFLYQSASASAAYNVAFPARIRSPLDVDALLNAFRELVARHPLLRTTYTLRDGEPVQRIHTTLPVDFEVLDLPETSIEEIRQRACDDVRAPYDLHNGPILRVRIYRRAPDDHVLVFGAPHIAVDGWSVWLMLDELRRLYPAALSNSPAALEPLPYRYSDYVRWQQQLLDAPAGDELREYWAELLSGSIDRLELPTDHDRPAVFRFAGDVRSFTLGPELTAAARKFARQEGVTLYTLFLAIYQTLLHRYSGQAQFLVGSPTTGRTRTEFAPVVGCFVNGVTLRADFSGTPSFRDVLRNVHRTVLGALAHQDYPLSLVNRNLRSRDASRATGFQVDFVFQKPQQQGDVARLLEGEREGAPVEFAGLQVEGFQVPQQAGQLDLTLELLEGPDQITGDFKYHTDLFESATIDRLVRHFLTLAESALTTPDTTVDRLPLLPADERAAIDACSRGPAVDLPPVTVVDRFDEALALGHGRAAVVVGGAEGVGSSQGVGVPRGAGAGAGAELIGKLHSHAGGAAAAKAYRTISYGVLAGMVDDVCAVLDAVGAGERVAYCFVPSERSVATVFGVWKSGRTAIPIDPAQPRERIAQILAEAKPSLLIAEHAVRAVLPPDPRMLWWEELDALAAPRPDAAPLRSDIAVPLTDGAAPGRDTAGFHGATATAARRAKPGDAAYVIFTSGSTGRPKGVVVSHGSLLNALVGWEIDYDLGPDDVHFQMAAPAFDVWMGDLVRALCTGGTLVVCPREWLLLPERLAGLIASERVTVAEFVPAVFRELRDHLVATSGRLETMRLVACGSDQWYQGEIAGFRQILPPHCRLVNSYGVTEATIDSSWFELESTDATNRDRQVPIGRPFANVRLYVVDGNLEPVPFGVVGELCIGGPGVALGYLDRSELDAERFVPDPHNPPHRLYRTGDLARLHADGTFELVGRADAQVKIRGNRVELGEIEARLCEHVGVRGAVAVYERGPAGSGGRLGAFVVPVDGQDVDPADLRSFVRDKLPAWMVPGTIRLIDRIPLSPSGKVDRKALPPLGSDGESGLDRTSPTTDTETRLLELWREVLDAADFGIHADFFQLGGHSLLGTRMVWLVGERLGVELPFHVIFEAPTVAELARRVDAARLLSQPVPAGATETFEF